MRYYSFRLIILPIFVLACNENVQREEKYKAKVHIDEKNVFNIDEYIFPYKKETTNSSKCISGPVAISFFGINQKLRKFDGKNIDSLPEKLRNPNRQEIYKAYEVWGMYHAIIEPELKKLSVRIIDSLEAKGVISFKNGRDIYSVDLNSFNEKDGVVMFQPNKEPIFWTNEKEGDWVRILNCYYKSCPVGK